MSKHRADVLAVAIIVASSLVVCWPLVTRLEGVPPDDDDLDLDLMSYYGYAGAARQTVMRFGQFPLRSPWHGGGYPLYAYPDDMTLTPTFPLILAVGPWAAIKIDFLLTMIVAGLGMYLLTRASLGYPPAAALLSATAFALGGFLLARWLRGWRVPTHAVWLPVILYALWRGRTRRWWLAVAAGLVAWLIIDHKYVFMVMAWFLAMVGLLRLDGDGTDDGSNRGKRESGRAAWGFFGRLFSVWVFGAGMAAVKLLPMAPLLREHLRSAPPKPAGHNTALTVVLWLVIFVALGVTPLIGRLVGSARTRVRGLALATGVLLAVIAATALCAPPRRPNPPNARAHLREVVNGVVSFGTWRPNSAGVMTPTAGDKYRGRAPVGPMVLVLAVAAVVLRPRRTWKWAVLGVLFVAFEVGPALPRELGESVRRLPFLSLVRRPREQLNFYLFFTVTLMAGRALDWRRSWASIPALRVVAWGLVAVNVVYLAWQTVPRYAYSVSAEAPPAAPWGDYELLDHRDPRGRPSDRWRDQPCFLLRSNVGLQYWDLDFRDRRHTALEPSLVIGFDGAPKANRSFRGMAFFDMPANRAVVKTFTPHEIVVDVTVRQPAVLLINQIGDDDWQPSEGTLLPESLLLAVDLTRKGTYDVRLRYVPTLLYNGLVVTGVVAAGGVLLLVLIGRRERRGNGRD